MGFGKTRGEVLKIAEETMWKKGQEVGGPVKDGGVAFGKGGQNLVQNMHPHYPRHWSDTMVEEMNEVLRYVK